MAKQSKDIEPVDIEVGERIKNRRRKLEMSQGELASAIGVTFQQVQKYESGRNRVSASMLVKIAAKLQTTCYNLIGETPSSLGDIFTEYDVMRAARIWDPTVFKDNGEPTDAAASVIMKTREVLTTLRGIKG